MANPYVSIVSLPYGIPDKTPTVVQIPAGYSLAKLRIRNDEFWTVFLKKDNLLEQWHVDFVNKELNQIKPSWPVVKKIRY